MKRHSNPILMTIASVAILVTACGDDGSNDTLTPDVPEVTGITFTAAVTNPYFPLPVGATWTYQGITDEGLERIEVEVLDPLVAPKMVNGFEVTVVEDIVLVDGEVVEYTHDWFAQDSAGNVWYLGEDTCEFDPGTYDPKTFTFSACEDPEGAWEWNVDGALPGILMPAEPKVDGNPFYQEFYPGHAEDVGEVVEVGVSVSVPAGAFENCIKTHDTSTLERDQDEFKYYCPGVGTVLAEEDDEREELINYKL
jgi:hypothetical protein